MRNRIDDELQHIRKEARTVKFALPAHSTYEALLKQHQLSGWSPPRAQVMTLTLTPTLTLTLSTTR